MEICVQLTYITKLLATYKPSHSSHPPLFPSTQRSGIGEPELPYQDIASSLLPLRPLKTDLGFVRLVAALPHLVRFRDHGGREIRVYIYECRFHHCAARRGVSGRAHVWNEVSCNLQTKRRWVDLLAMANSLPIQLRGPLEKVKRCLCSLK